MFLFSSSPAGPFDRQVKVAFVTAVGGEGIWGEGKNPDPLFFPAIFFVFGRSAIQAG